MVECTALEMRHTRKGIGGSNPPLSASELVHLIENTEIIEIGSRPSESLSQTSNWPRTPCAGRRTALTNARTVPALCAVTATTHQAPSDGANRGSIPLGRTNLFKDLDQESVFGSDMRPEIGVGIRFFHNWRTDIALPVAAKDRIRA